MNKMPKFTRRLVTAACSAALALGAASSANAGVLAQGVLDITNFRLSSTTGVPLSQSGDFVFILANHTTDGTATLNGISDTGSASDAVYPYTLDMPQQSVGVNPFGENNYTHRPPGYGGYFARTDTRLFGDSICFTGGACPPSGVTAQVVGEVQLNATGDGSTQANIGLQAEFQFTLASAQAVRVDFDADDYLIAFMGALSAVPGSSAFASSGWTLTLTGPGVDFTFAPDGVLQAGEVSDPCSLNTNRSALTPNAPLGNIYSCIGHFAAVSPVLAANTTYQLSIRHTIETDAAKVLLRVPEPGTIGLLGAGLLGMFGVALRTRRRDRT